jgi:hypothetical protein
MRLCVFLVLRSFMAGRSQNLTRLVGYQQGHCIVLLLPYFCGASPYDDSPGRRTTVSRTRVL